VVTLLLCGIVLLPYVLLTPEVISNIYLLMLLKTLIPTFAAGFLIFCGLLEYIFQMMGALEIEEQFHDPLLDEPAQEERNREKSIINGSEPGYETVNRLSLLERHVVAG